MIGLVAAPGVIAVGRRRDLTPLILPGLRLHDDLLSRSNRSESYTLGALLPPPSIPRRRLVYVHVPISGDEMLTARCLASKRSPGMLWNGISIFGSASILCGREGWQILQSKCKSIWATRTRSLRRWEYRGDVRTHMVRPCARFGRKSSRSRKRLHHQNSCLSKNPGSISFRRELFSQLEKTPLA
jgi:hypothetical protein